MKYAVKVSPIDGSPFYGIYDSLESAILAVSDMGITDFEIECKEVKVKEKVAPVRTHQ